MDSSINITPILNAKARDTVEIHLPDGRLISGPRGALVSDFLKVLPEWSNPPIVGAVVNYEIRELTFPIDMDARVAPITMDDDDGARIYRRSLTFLLEAAFEEIFPESILAVDHSVPSGGFYCQVVGGAPLTVKEITSIETHMRKMVKEDLPFERLSMPLDEAIEFFEKKKNDDKVRLLKYRQKGHLVLYRLGEHQDYLHGYMLPSTGYLRWFSVVPLGEGFVLQYPRRKRARGLSPLPQYPKLVGTFQQYGKWLERLGIECVGALNDAIQAGKIREIILVSEALHEERIADIARQIISRKDQAHIVLIAGPSSSGKTTFSKRLAVQLLAQGVSPYPLELDNYFVDRDATPLDENNKQDFEALEAVDRVLLEDHLKRLIAGEAVQLPHYNFKMGCRETGDIVQLGEDQMIILEGIHGLDPRLLPDMPIGSTFRIYASSLTQLNLDRYNRISTTDTRLIRRIVRDSKERGYSAQQTIQRWESVTRGEKKYIFPYQENADAIFNSALVYEMSALKLLVEPLLRQVNFGTYEYIEAKRLLAFLEWFLPVDTEMIPDNSILREFVGGSILSEFKLWQDTPVKNQNK
jgi:uridine kinase